jgi:hypothetical protein
MKCWVCKHQARGAGHRNNAQRQLDHVFCSQRCQDVFYKMYGEPTEIPTMNAIDFEMAAMRSCLKAFGQVASEIGFKKALGSYSEAEALQVIDAIVLCYTRAMYHHEDTQIRAKSESAESHKPAAEPATDLFSMRNDIPWEAPK